MATEKKFIQKALLDFSLKQFLERELANAGVSSIEIQKTPIATRIAIMVRRPGLVVGKKGKAIKDIASMLQSQYKVENPQIEVIEVSVPSLDAKLMAEKVGRQLEIKGNVKTAMRFALKEIMAAGAIGAEIRAAGKLVGKGGKARTLTIRAGYLKKSGEESRKVKEGKYTAHLKAGAVGISVKIVPPGTVFSDNVDVSTLVVPQEKILTEEQKEQVVEKKEEKKKVTRRRTRVKTAKTEATPESAPSVPAVQSAQESAGEEKVKTEEAIKEEKTDVEPPAPEKLPEPQAT